jgi:hypothetical protein
MTTVIDASIHTLNKSVSLLNQLNDSQLSNATIPPYFSCIGAHVRHILDVYDCILEGLDSKVIDLTSRKRDERMNCDCSYSISKVEAIITKLSQIDLNTIQQTGYTLRDDLGLGLIEMNYTLDAALSQANSHAIHHYAIINYILDRLELTFEDADFGYNPTSPKNTPVTLSS